MNIMYASFDEVPSFKGASTHILSGLREAVRTRTVHLVTLGAHAIRPTAGLFHHPVAIREPNLARRALLFREQVAGRIRRFKPDLVHFRSPWEGIAAINAGVPSLFEVNGLPSMELPYYYKDLSPKTIDTLRAWESRCLTRAAAIICPSERTARFLREQFTIPDTTPIEVLPNAYDPVPERFHRASLPSTELPLRMVYLGTLSPWQGIFWSLKGFSLLEKQCTLDIYAPYSKQNFRRIERRIRRLQLADQVRLHDVLHRRAMHDCLPQYDYGFAPFMKTSRNVEQGCFPLKLLDYLGHGLPVIAANLAISRQLLNSHNALFFEPNSMHSLIDLLRDAATNRGRHQSLRTAARGTLDKHWTWADYGSRLCEIYDGLVR